MAKEKILVIGALGQIGTDLNLKLGEMYGYDNVIAADIKQHERKLERSGPYEYINVLDKHTLVSVVHTHQITQIYHLAALLSATSETNPQLAWELNMDGLLNVLYVARDNKISKLFWPSSIAVFGPNTPKVKTPQRCIKDPNTIYGISKLAGERWSEYFHEKFGLDIRSLRYPGLISYKSPPGGGTTDYAIHIFHEALKDGSYECFLKEDTKLPMMYMPDAIRSTIELMEASSENIKIRSSYNITALSFSPHELTKEIQKHIPDFNCTYSPDSRQVIADS
ncbi:NAD-dependent epimerase/dehydratase family protein, partial [Candidatus Amoebophilus asiaticus]|nr:NAD-dependent epimerase/dehydratase family protein [Candidatus Amoebophilus asiaticus]